MKKKMESMMGGLILAIVLGVSVYYNSNSLYVCTSQKNASDLRHNSRDSSDEDVNSKENGENDRILKEKDVTVVLDPGHGGG